MQYKLIFQVHFFLIYHTNLKDNFSHFYKIIQKLDIYLDKNIYLNDTPKSLQRKITPNLLNKIEQHNQLDIQLYQFAKQLFLQNFTHLKKTSPKYYIGYFDIIGIEHRLDIFDDTYEDEAIQVDGNVTLTYSDTDDSLEAIRGQGLRVELEADTTLTFNDLWSEDEKTYKVEYYRNFELIFNGWLNPDGWFENWVNTNWIITFDCVDGLGYLSDLSFVKLI